MSQCTRAERKPARCIERETEANHCRRQGHDERGQRRSPRHDVTHRPKRTTGGHDEQREQGFSQHLGRRLFDRPLRVASHLNRCKDDNRQEPSARPRRSPRMCHGRDSTPKQGCHRTSRASSSLIASLRIRQMARTGATSASVGRSALALPRIHPTLSELGTPPVVQGFSPFLGMSTTDVAPVPNAKAKLWLVTK